MDMKGGGNNKDKEHESDKAGLGPHFQEVIVRPVRKKQFLRFFGCTKQGLLTVRPFSRGTDSMAAIAMPTGFWITM